LVMIIEPRKNHCQWMPSCNLRLGKTTYCCMFDSKGCIPEILIRVWHDMTWYDICPETQKCGKLFVFKRETHRR
jgi:hypothetical protein